MSAARVPATVAKSIDHDLRALLLRLADGEPTFDPMFGLEEGKAIISGTKRGLLTSTHQLTPLGREVAELCRPPKWTAAIRSGQVAIDKPDGEVEFIGAWEYEPGGWEIREAFDRAQRVVDLLNADELAKAKVYGSKP